MKESSSQYSRLGKLWEKKWTDLRIANHLWKMILITDHRSVQQRRFDSISLIIFLIIFISSMNSAKNFWKFKKFWNIDGWNVILRFKYFWLFETVVNLTFENDTGLILKSITWIMRSWFGWRIRNCSENKNWIMSWVENLLIQVTK